MDLNQLRLEVDGVTRTFAQWSSDFVDTYYPRLGQACYRVPALYFNQQDLSRKGKPSSLSEQQYCVLNNPDASKTIGDLAHTIVLEKLEDLSHHLQASGCGPLFIISAVDYDNYLAKLSSTFRPKNPSKCSNGKKRQLPPRPCDGDKRTSKGELDILVLHKQAGVVMIEVKGVGSSRRDWQPSEEELRLAVQQRVKKSEEQLRNGRDILRYIMPDLNLPRVTLVVALPYVTRQQLDKAISTLSLDPNLRFLCKDDLGLWRPCCENAGPSQTETGEDNGAGPPQDGGIPDLLRWWDDTAGGDVSSELPVDSMKTIVGRICGLMSVVCVWTTSRPRMEVHTAAQAIAESGRRLVDIVLLPRQAEILAQPSLPRLWLTGPMGSGKTLMLQLKGRQWLEEGRRVIIINVRFSSRGRPQGHVLERSIRRDPERDCGAGSVERYDVAVDEFDFESLHSKLVAGGPTENACFLVDEVLSDMSIIPQTLSSHYPDCQVWCAASYMAPVPPTFQRKQLRAVLRSPPSIQLMLRELDLNPTHESAYTARSATRGLSCDGPPIIFIEHSKHNTDVRHVDCEECANELADIFEKKLGLKLQPPAQQERGSGSSPEAGMDSQQSRSFTEKNEDPPAAEAAPLSFRDVLILTVLPKEAFSHVKKYHWEVQIPEAIKYCIYMGMCNFVKVLKQRGVPLKFAVDNTQKEIAFPPQNEVIIADIMGAHSLERKVVILLRTGPPLTTEEIMENMLRYQTIQAEVSAGNQTEIDSLRRIVEGPLDAVTTTKQLERFVSLMQEIRDMLYPQLPAVPVSSAAEAKSKFYDLFENMLVKGTQMFTSVCKDDLQDRQNQPESSTMSSFNPYRHGMEYRCHAPLLSDDDDGSCIQEEEDEAATSGRREDAEDEEVVGATPSFFVPGTREDMEQRQEEVRRIRKALESLSEDDLDWEFLAASRCLSQYISIIP